MKTWWLKIKIYFLRRELRSGFTIGGYKDGLVRIVNKRFLEDWEVKLVHQWRDEGKLIDAGEWSVTSPNGPTYTNKLYKLL